MVGRPTFPGAASGGSSRRSRPLFLAALGEPAKPGCPNFGLTKTLSFAMPDQIRSVSPGPKAGSVRTADGAVLMPPVDWGLLPPGDAALSRRVKKEGPHWLVTEKRGRKVFSRGIWAPKERIDRLRSQLEAERQDPKYTKKLEAGRAKRAAEQVAYAADFEQQVFHFLDFADCYDALAKRMAKAISDHAVPVGSGTVARTQRISIERRAEAATIAWMRHQTTAYDNMKIPRVKGMRREVRRMLADRSRALLDRYRHGLKADASCPLAGALAGIPWTSGRSLNSFVVGLLLALRGI